MHSIRSNFMLLQIFDVQFDAQNSMKHQPRCLKKSESQNNAKKLKICNQEHCLMFMTQCNNSYYFFMWINCFFVAKKSYWKPLPRAALALLLLSSLPAFPWGLRGQQLEIKPPYLTVFHHLHHLAWVKSYAVPSKILNVIGSCSSRSKSIQ